MTLADYRRKCRQYTCSYCDAPAGTPCRNADNEQVEYVHDDRSYTLEWERQCGRASR